MLGWWITELSLGEDCSNQNFTLHHHNFQSHWEAANISGQGNFLHGFNKESESFIAHKSSILRRQVSCTLSWTEPVSLTCAACDLPFDFHSRKVPVISYILVRATEVGTPAKTTSDRLADERPCQKLLTVNRLDMINPCNYNWLLRVNLWENQNQKNFGK